MNTKLLLLIISIATISSCTTMYKSGQTPDDVYFSPVRTYGEGSVKQDDSQDEARNYYNNNEDWQIRMGITDPRWRYLDNEISYNPYLYGYNYGYYYNPYYCSYPVYNPVVVVVNNPKTTTPRMVNLGGYGNGYNNINTALNSKTNYITPRPARTYNNNNGSSFGNTLRKILSPGGNSNSTNNSSNSSNRTYSPSSSGSSSGGNVSRPARRGGGN